MVADLNLNTVKYVAYGWSNSGPYQFGNYVGNGNTDGPFININGAPATAFGKSISGSVGGWVMWANKDAMLDINPVGRFSLQGTTAYTEPGSEPVDLASNGFKIGTEFSAKQKW